jgi:polyhydroxybutyrate depolymerase
LTALAVASIPFVSPATEVQQLSLDDHTREYLLSAPAAGHRLPTIVALHGTLLNAQRTMLSMGFEPLVDREGLVVVYPNAVAAQWNDGRPAAAALTWDVDDVGFIRGLIGYLVDKGVSDPRRIYVTGFSNGGMMALRLVCEAPELIAAAAAIAATFPVELAADCKPPRATPVLVMNGTTDPIVPYVWRRARIRRGQGALDRRDNRAPAHAQSLHRRNEARCSAEHRSG